MNDNCLDITFLSLPERAQAAMQVYLEGAGREVFRAVAEDQAEVAIFDFDHPLSRAHWERFRTDIGRPCIALAIAEQTLPNAVWVGKPVTALALAEVATKLRVQLKSAPVSTTPATPSSPAERTIRVALLSLEPRNEAALNMFFRGEGRSIFSPSAEEDADAGIFDYDHPASRAHWEAFNAQTKRPGILFSIHEQALPNTVWVSKPVTPAGLLKAASLLPKPSRVAALIASRTAVPVVAAATAAIATEPALPLEASNDAIAETAVPAAPPISVETTPEVRPPSEPVAPVRNWVHPPSEQKKPPVIAWVVGGVALLAALWFWMRPTGVPAPQTADNTQSKPVSQGTVSASSAVPNAPANDPLRSAVDSSVAEYRAKSTSDTNFVTAQLDQLYQRGSGAAEDVKAKLDRLAADPKAQAEYNQSVYNKIHLEPTAAGTPRGAAAERDLRSRIEAEVNNAVAAPKDDAFSTALAAETKVREAEMRTITVMRGDTLSAIAQRAYGDAALYMKIVQANPRVLTSPDHIYPDQVLRIPQN